MVFPQTTLSSGKFPSQLRFVYLNGSLFQVLPSFHSLGTYGNFLYPQHPLARSSTGLLPAGCPLCKIFFMFEPGSW